MVEGTIFILPNVTLPKFVLDSSFHFWSPLEQNASRCFNNASTWVDIYLYCKFPMAAKKRGTRTYLPSTPSDQLVELSFSKVHRELGLTPSSFSLIPFSNASCGRLLNARGSPHLSCKGASPARASAGFLHVQPRACAPIIGSSM